MKIRAIRAREILDSRGNPTVEVDVELTNGIVGTAAVPAGASTGAREAHELRDGSRRYHGKGVRKALQNIRDLIAPLLVGRNVLPQAEIDRQLIDLDGTPNKSRLGANAILGVSLACARTAALALHQPLFQYLAPHKRACLPVPLVNVLNGGAHADNGLDIQEFMLVPIGFDSFQEALRATVETFHVLKQLLQEQGLSTAVGDEGGFAPKLAHNEEGLKLLSAAIAAAGYTPGRDLALALDVAASELFTPPVPSPPTARAREGYRFEGQLLSAADLIKIYGDWLKRYPIVSLEDGLAEDDWRGWQALTQELGARLQIVGDDLFATNATILQQGIREGIANAILIKLNQIGTVTETLQVIEIAQQHGYNAIVSHRSGETEDTFIADLAVSTGVGQIKTGSVCRGERTAKYNRLLRLEEQFSLELARPFSIRRSL